MGELSERNRALIAGIWPVSPPRGGDSVLTIRASLLNRLLDAARSEAQPSGYDGGKSLGERLFDSVVAAEPGAKVVPWRELDSSVQSKMEKAALTFTASLSDASPKPAEGQK